MKHAFTISAIPAETAQRIRTSRNDDFGNVLEPQIQDEYGNPCRLCLRRAQPGESLLLFSYSPFVKQNPYAETGPVFVHADGCEAYAAPHAYPEEFRQPVVLRAYNIEQHIVRAEAVVDGSLNGRLDALLDDRNVTFIQARSLTHGCYFFRIDRQ